MNETHFSGARKLWLTSAALAATALLTGCSVVSRAAPDPAAPSVASVPTTAAASSGPTPAATTAAAVNGPLIRADTTGEEIGRWMVAWGACLTDHGVPGITKENAGKIDPELYAKYPEAMDACQSKRPEVVTERYKREHPQAFQAQLKKFIKCMKDDGQKIIFIAPDGWGVSDEQAQSGYTPNERSMTKCENNAYGS